MKPSYFVFITLFTLTCFSCEKDDPAGFDAGVDASTDFNEKEHPEDGLFDAAPQTDASSIDLSVDDVSEDVRVFEDTSGDVSTNTDTDQPDVPTTSGFTDNFAGAMGL